MAGDRPFPVVALVADYIHTRLDCMASVGLDNSADLARTSAARKHVPAD